MFEEFERSEDGMPDLRIFIEENNLTDSQKRLMASYVKQILSQVQIG
jgi:hypothetical protein